jgi:CheY-like chemotaxis protein/anti-sigma regulatory factor (Ser/Thr protein kinase)
LNDILDLSKVEAGKLTLQSGSIDPVKLLQETLELFNVSAEKKGLTIHTHWLGTANARYQGDGQRLQQMLNNLVNNAIKFTTQGEITIEAKPVANNGEIEFSVTDTGIGIAAEQQQFLFKPFSQLDNSSTRQYSGTGLGLSIVQKLAQLMQGESGVESQLGKGSRFWFRVQLETLTDIPTSEAKQNHNVALSQLEGCVLIVEDNLINQMVVENQLQQFGLQTFLAENGQQAVEFVQKQAHQVDAILMDIQMPVMDGYQATQIIREWEQTHQRISIPIIALTADAFEENRQKGLAIGMNDYLTKPLDQQTLFNVLASYLVK